MKQKLHLWKSMFGSMAMATVLMQPLSSSADEQLCDYAVYSAQGTTLQDNTTVEGDVGSGNGLAIGADVEIMGNVAAGSDAVLRNRAVVDGTATAQGDIVLYSGAFATGGTNPYTPVSPISIPEKTIAVGTDNFNIWPGQTIDLDPGTYNNFHAYSNTSVGLKSGVYNFNEFVLEAGLRELVLDVSEGPIEINAQGLLRFGDRLNMSMVGGNDANLVTFYSNYTGQIPVGTDSVITGSITAPQGDVVAYSRTLITGSIYAKTVRVEPTTIIEAAGCNDECAYECNMNIYTGATDCTGVVERLDAGSTGLALLKANLDGYNSMTVSMDFCDNVEWVLNIGNSPCNNGAAGDCGAFSNDSELDIRGTELRVWGNDYAAPDQLLYSDPTFLPMDSCGTTKEVTISDGKLVLPSTTIESDYLFRLNQPDDEGTPDANIYVGLNRVVAGEYRRGTGIASASFCIR